MAETYPTMGADEYFGPSMSGNSNGGNAYAVMTYATIVDLNALLKTSTIERARGGAWFTFQPRGCDVYYRMKPTTATPNTTTGNASTGIKQAEADGKFHIWVTPEYPYMDVIASANANLFFYMSSPNYGNRVT